MWVGNSSYCKPSVIEWPCLFKCITWFLLVTGAEGQRLGWIPGVGVSFTSAGWSGRVCHRYKWRVFCCVGRLCPYALLPSLVSCTLILGCPWWTRSRIVVFCEVWNWVCYMWTVAISDYSSTSLCFCNKPFFIVIKNYLLYIYISCQFIVSWPVLPKNNF